MHLSLMVGGEARENNEDTMMGMMGQWGLSCHAGSVTQTRSKWACWHVKLLWIPMFSTQ